MNIETSSETLSNQQSNILFLYLFFPYYLIFWSYGISNTYSLFNLRNIIFFRGLHYLITLSDISLSAISTLPNYNNYMKIIMYNDTIKN